LEITGAVVSGGRTVTVAGAVVGPTSFVAVNVYVVVAVGETTVEPDPGPNTSPPGLIVIPVAPEVLHDSVLLVPDAIVVGLALKLRIAGAVGTPWKL
jgi:hypothetical protein